MNILPHKSWHVRTKKNIARVRADEAKAAEEEKEKERRIALAAQEARTSFLRQRASERFVAEGESQNNDLDSVCASKVRGKDDVSDVIQSDGHVNFFMDIEAGLKLGGVNQEHEEEKKREQEEYEKKIGYLTYLGQNSIEETKERPWYEKSSIARAKTCEAKPSVSKEDAESKLRKEAKLKDFHDPLKNIRKYLHTPGVKTELEKSSVPRKRKLSNADDDSESKSRKVKSKKKIKKLKIKHKHKSKHKKSKGKKKKLSGNSSYDDSSESNSDIDKGKEEQLKALRRERMEREKEEARKAAELMAKLRGDPLPEKIAPPVHERVIPAVRQKYNSQFNPHLARQNFDDHPSK